jgi:hypothetical protein
MILTRETEELDKNLSKCDFVHPNPTWTDLGANRGLHGQRSASNSLSHNMTIQIIVLRLSMMESSVKRRLAEMSSVECRKLSSVSAHIAVAIFRVCVYILVGNFLLNLNKGG